MREKSEDQIIRTEYSEVMQKSYIDYAMSVIISRALPDVRITHTHLNLPPSKILPTSFLNARNLAFVC